jgi:hypothetical protein
LEEKKGVAMKGENWEQKETKGRKEELRQDEQDLQDKKRKGEEGTRSKQGLSIRKASSDQKNHAS